jgi:hypothetical protein
MMAIGSNNKRKGGFVMAGTDRVLEFNGNFERIFSRLDSTPLYALKTKSSLFRLMSYSHGILFSETYRGRRVAGLGEQIRALNIGEIFIHHDRASRLAAAELGAHAFCFENHVFLGPAIDTDIGPSLVQALSHEFTHLVQVQKSLSCGKIDDISMVEEEAGLFSHRNGQVAEVQYGADPGKVHCLWWLLPLAAAAYAILRPNVANAPGPDDKIQASISDLQVAGEAFALFYIPGAAYQICGRLGLGFISSSALAGASMTTTFRGVQDISKGQFSGIQVYVIDAATGAVIGVVVPGGIRLIGRAGTTSLDWLATHGMRRSDLAISRVIAERAASNPLTQGEVVNLMNSRKIGGKMAEWWLNRRGLIILWRGQGQPTTQILSPLARESGVAASEAMVARMRAAGLTDQEIAGYTAKWHTQPIPVQFTPAQLADQPLGAAGIPASQLPGIASNFGDEGIVYIIRIPKITAIKVPQWGLAVENEWVILNQIPKGSVVGYMPPSKIPALEVNEAGQLIPVR